jgi:hypothetical protein
MPFVKTFTTLVILFVIVNLLMIIYKIYERKMREGMENKYEDEDDNLDQIPNQGNPENNKENNLLSFEQCKRYCRLKNANYMNWNHSFHTQLNADETLKRPCYCSDKTNVSHGNDGWTSYNVLTSERPSHKGKELNHRENEETLHTDSQAINSKKQSAYETSAEVDTQGESKMYPNNRTTGLMTETDIDASQISSSTPNKDALNSKLPGVNLRQSNAQLKASRSLNPSASFGRRGLKNPKSQYKTGPPRDPRLKPSPYNSLMDIF